MEVHFYYNFDIEITPVWMGRKAIYVSLCYIRIEIYVCRTHSRRIWFPIWLSPATPHSKGNNGKNQAPHSEHTHVYEVWKSEIRVFNVNACVFIPIICIFTTPSVCNMSITPHLLFSFVTWEAAHRNSTSVPIINYVWILYRWAYTF